MKQSAKSVAANKKKKFTTRQVISESLLVMVAIAAIFLFLALISFDPSDPGWSQTAWNSPIYNWCGVVGAYLSDVLLQFVGFIAYTIPIWIVIFCVQGMSFFYHNDKPINYLSLSLRVIGLLAFMFSATGFFALNIQDASQFQAGGILGEIVLVEMMPLFNQIGSSVILFAVSVACVTLLTGLSWLFIFEKIGVCVVFIAKPIVAISAIIGQKITTRQSAHHQANSDDDNSHEDDAPPLQIALDMRESAHNNTHNSNDLDSQNDTDNDSNSESVDEEDEKPIVTSIWGIDSAPSPSQFAATASHSSKHDEQWDDSDEETVPTIPASATAPLVLDNSDEKRLIDENTLPSHMIQDDDEWSARHESAINSDYYSPITLSRLEDGDLSVVNLANNNITQQQVIASASINDDETEHETLLTTIDEDSDIKPIGGHVREAKKPQQLETAALSDSLATDPITGQLELTKENIHDSLIHPLLRRNERVVKKPTTPLPSLELLTQPPLKQVAVDHQALKAMARLIEQSLDDFRVKARVVDYLPGPVITRFEIELAPGVKAARISTLDRDLARSLSMPSVRVVEVIPGKSYVGIELPNQHRQTVYFKEVLDSPQFKEAKSPLTIVLGKDIAGQSVVADLAKMPHVLVAGTTGSGKSVGVNAMILSILYKSQPEDVRFIMIDPKMLELSIYEGIPHLLTEVVTDMKDAANALNWCVNEMERRYRLMSVLGVRNIVGYNEKIKLAEEMGRPIPDPLWRPNNSMDIEMPMLEKLPYIVVMVDEFADLIMAVGKKVEELIARLAQKARAAGIHLVLATQRPSVDVITGLIKANIPTRIAFTVSSKIDSRTILDQMGAESLLGMGDMLYLAPNSSIPVRVHGAFVRDEEVHSVVQDWKARGKPNYVENITATTEESESDGFSDMQEELDPIFDQVVSFVVDKRRASISSVQRQFRIGYNRAARIVEQMEMQGIVSPPAHNGNREVLAPPSSSDY